MNNKPEQKQSGWDVRKTFKRGQESESPIVRRTTRVAEYIWDTVLILGRAVANTPDGIKDKYDGFE